MRHGRGCRDPLVMREDGQGRPRPPSQQHPSAPGEEHGTRLLFSILYFNDHILALVTALKGFFGSCCGVRSSSSLI